MTLINATTELKIRPRVRGLPTAVPANKAAPLGQPAVVAGLLYMEKPPPSTLAWRSCASVPFDSLPPPLPQISRTRWSGLGGGAGLGVGAASLVEGVREEGRCAEQGSHLPCELGRHGVAQGGGERDIDAVRAAQRHLVMVGVGVRVGARVRVRVRVSVRVRVRVGVTRPPYFWMSAAVSLRSSESIVPVVGWWVGQ